MSLEVEDQPIYGNVTLLSDPEREKFSNKSKSKSYSTDPSKAGDYRTFTSSTSFYIEDEQMTAMCSVFMFLASVYGQSTCGLLAPELLLTIPEDLLQDAERIIGSALTWQRINMTFGGLLVVYLKSSPKLRYLPPLIGFFGSIVFLFLTFLFDPTNLSSLTKASICYAFTGLIEGVGYTLCPTILLNIFVEEPRGHSWINAQVVGGAIAGCLASLVSALSPVSQTGFLVAACWFILLFFWATFCFLYRQPKLASMITTGHVGKYPITQTVIIAIGAGCLIAVCYLFIGWLPLYVYASGISTTVLSVELLSALFWIGFLLSRLLALCTDTHPLLLFFFKAPITAIGFFLWVIFTDSAAVLAIVSFIFGLISYRYPLYGFLFGGLFEYSKMDLYCLSAFYPLGIQIATLYDPCFSERVSIFTTITLTLPSISGISAFLVYNLSSNGFAVALIAIFGVFFFGGVTILGRGF